MSGERRIHSVSYFVETTYASELIGKSLEEAIEYRNLFRPGGRIRESISTCESRLIDESDGVS